MMSARLFKPARIIAVDRHDERGQFALDHGWADVFINSKKEDVEARVKELTEGRGADAVIEAAGKDGTFQLAWKIAVPMRSSPSSPCTRKIRFCPCPACMARTSPGNPAA